MANLLVMKEIEWEQKARIRWIQEGDRNTRFFHVMARHPKKINCVHEMTIGGQIVKENKDLRRESSGHFKNLYTADAVWRPPLDDMSFASLETMDRDWLTREFTEDEIRKCLIDCEGNKAPRPDGFNMKFFQQNWGIIKEDLFGVFKKFHILNSL